MTRCPIGGGALFSSYRLNEGFDEMFEDADRRRSQYAPFTPWMSRDASAPLTDPAVTQMAQQQQQQQQQ